LFDEEKELDCVNFGLPVKKVVGQGRSQEVQSNRIPQLSESRVIVAAVIALDSSFCWKQRRDPRMTFPEDEIAFLSTLLVWKHEFHILHSHAVPEINANAVFVEIVSRNVVNDIETELATLEEREIP
jgi:hypothetical protein